MKAQKPEIVIKETVKRDATFEASLNEVTKSVESGIEKGETKTGISFIKILNTIVLF